MTRPDSPCDCPYWGKTRHVHYCGYCSEHSKDVCTIKCNEPYKYAMSYESNNEFSGDYMCSCVKDWVTSDTWKERTDIYGNPIPLTDRLVKLYYDAGLHTKCKPLKDKE